MKKELQSFEQEQEEVNGARVRFHTSASENGTCWLSDLSEIELRSTTEETTKETFHPQYDYVETETVIHKKLSLWIGIVDEGWLEVYSETLETEDTPSVCKYLLQHLQFLTRLGIERCKVNKEITAELHIDGAIRTAKEAILKERQARYH